MKVAGDLVLQLFVKIALKFPHLAAAQAGDVDVVARAVGFVIVTVAAQVEQVQFVDVAKAVIAQEFLRDRSIVFERLQRLGIHCLDVPSRGLSVALINRYLLIKQRGLI